MNLLLRNFSAVLVYHATYEDVPKDIRQNLHNVTPAVVYEHLLYLKKNYRMLCVDELAAAVNVGGVAAITFDDGYKCVIDHIHDMLVDLDIPFTIYINSSSIDGNMFWRDKVRYIINNNLVKEFESFTGHGQLASNLPFYKYTKHPSNNSKLIDEQLDNFFNYKNISLNVTNYCFDDLRYLKGHNLVSYGNHTHNHYVLSSLSYEEQYGEIYRTRQFLDSIPNIQVSEVFSIPFGGDGDFNQDTLSVLQELGYRAALLSRQRLNFGLKKDRGVLLIERFMPGAGSLPLLLGRLRSGELLP